MTAVKMLSTKNDLRWLPWFLVAAVLRCDVGLPGGPDCVVRIRMSSCAFIGGGEIRPPVTWSGEPIRLCFSSHLLLPAH